MDAQSLGQWLQGIIDPGANGAVIVRGLQLDSRRVGEGDAFFALRGIHQHGMCFARDAVRRGASVVLAEAPMPDDEAVHGNDFGVPVVWVEHLHARVGELAARFYGAPSSVLCVIGVTGTNGKTSVVQWLSQALTFLGCRPATIGTLGVGLHGQLRDSGYTTPDAIQVQALLAGFRDAGASHVVMEVSSHALAQARVAGVGFHLAVFTNLSRDHLDYHGSMHAYGVAKAKLLAWPGLKAAIVNIDDAFGRQLVTKLPVTAQVLRLSSAGSTDADVLAMDVSMSALGLDFRLCTPCGSQHVRSALLGGFNVDNLLAVAACLSVLGWPLGRVCTALEALQPVSGRMNRLGGEHGLPLVVVDYAHTPDALARSLGTLRVHCKGQLICVFGCGGERDSGKRPLMGELAVRLADRVILTDDNPRGEDGDVIVAQILAGIVRTHAVQVERDRARAIHAALAEAHETDVVLIAGKGHECFQEKAGDKRPFDDLTVAREALAECSMEWQA